MNRCIHCVVTGRVQGVFYRASTRDKARELGLVGWVRNTAGGGVELVACGDPDALTRLEEWLWQGPPAAAVDAVVCQAAPVPGCDDFSIRYR